MSDYPLPKKVAEILYAKDANETPANLSENFGLLFSRLLDSLGFENEKEKYKIWEDLVNESQEIYQMPSRRALPKRFQSEMEAILEGLHARLDRVENSYTKSGFKRFESELEMKVDWRLVVGLGNPSVLDTGLRLHSIYGFPYLPGQGLKGAVRNAWMSKKAERLGIERLPPQEIEESGGGTPLRAFENLLISAKKQSEISKKQFTALKNETGIKNLDFEEFFQKYVLRYQALFGGANGQGGVNFLDVLPTKLIVDGQSILEADVINPHYGEYYTGEGAKTPPADYLSPKPIFFLAVRRNTPFRFRVLAKDKKLLREAKSLIVFAAQNYGLGAKTFSGYGEMRLG